jgi:hypothetical protein
LPKTGNRSAAGTEPAANVKKYNGDTVMTTLVTRQDSDFTAIAVMGDDAMPPTAEGVADYLAKH